MRDILRYVINKKRVRKSVNQHHFDYADSFAIRSAIHTVARLQAEFRSLKCFVQLQSKSRTLHLKDAG